MVLATRAQLAPTVVVPDELSLTMWGHDPAALGLEPTGFAGQAQKLLVAEPLPQQLTAALEQLREDMPQGVATTTVAAPLAAAHDEVQHRGHEAHELHDEAHDHHDHHDHERHEQHDHHGGHDHADMMAITGEPSADGLVMEPIEFEHGPLAPALPGGLVLKVELDGDVVCQCEVGAALEVQPAPSPQVPLDPLAPTAWSVLIDAVTEAAGHLTVPPATQWQRLAAVELERALSHAAWLRSLGRLLGWQAFVEQCQAAVTALLAARPELPSGAGAVLPPDADHLGEAVPVLAQLRQTVQGSLALRARLQGRGRLASLDTPGLQGPNARAAGQPRDARSHDPLYDELGFQPLLESEGDALARTHVRAREGVQALELALAGLERTTENQREAPPQTTQPTASAAVEGPRGPLVAAQRDHLQLAAPGTAAALAAAGRAAIGLEWSAALVSVASFDLSPWQVPG